MINEIRIETYFEILDNSSLRPKDRTRLNNMRDTLSSFSYIEQQIEFIVKWRSYKENIEFDFRVFGISRNAIISRDLVDNHNKTRSTNIGVRNKNWSGRQEIEFDFPEDEDSNNSENEKENQKTNDQPNKKKFSLFNPFLLLIILLVFLIVNIGLYVYGYISSLGSSPFKLEEGRILKGGEVLGSPFNNIEGFSKEKDGYKMPVDYALAVSLGYDYTGQNYEGPDDLRGIGIYASEDFAWDGTDQFSRDNYAVAGRWEHWSYTIENNKWPNHALYGNKSPDGVRTSGINPVYTDCDSEYYSWLLNQKVLVVNPKNLKAVICMVGNGVTDTNWGGSPLSSGPLGLSYKAQKALGFKVDSEMDGGDFPFNCRDSGSIFGFQLEAFWVLDPDLYELGPIQLHLTPNLLPDPTPTPTPEPTPEPSVTPEPTPAPIENPISY